MLGIDIASDLLGIAGALLLAVPVLRDLSYREIVALLRPHRRPGSFVRAGEMAAGIAEAEMLRFRPSDRRCVVGGLLAIGASYALHMAGVILRELAR